MKALVKVAAGLMALLVCTVLCQAYERVVLVEDFTNYT